MCMVELCIGCIIVFYFVPCHLPLFLLMEVLDSLIAGILTTNDDIIRIVCLKKYRSEPMMAQRRKLLANIVFSY